MPAATRYKCAAGPGAVACFFGKAPSLTDVLDQLSKKNPKFKEATELLPQIEALMKEVYNDELEEEDSKLLSALIADLQAILKNLCN